MSEGANPSTGARRGLAIHSRNLRGGILVVLVTLALLAYELYVPGGTIVHQFLIGALLVVGIATAVGLIPVRAPQDYYGGIALVMLATLALIASTELPGQRGFAFGPGTAPRLFSILLAGLGACVALVGVFIDGPKIEKYAIRGPVLVIAAIVGFAAMIRPLGLIIASFVTFIVSILGSKEMRVLEALIGAAVMTVFCVLLFVYLLNLPFQLWPRF